MTDYLILVDENDKQWGKLEKLLVHQLGLLHRAFSVFENGLTEYEFDHVYFGITDDLPFPEKSEVKNYRYMNLKILEMDILVHPENYTEWMKICLSQVRNHYDKIIKNISLNYASI